MKKTIMTVLVAMSALATFAKGLSLAEARAKIGACVDKPETMTEVVKSLSKADQLSFVADVNEAISKMPGSNEAKAAKFIVINRAALKGAEKGNLKALIAEVFATVPPEILPQLNEQYASDLFNRNADPSVKYTDEQFTAIAQELMKVVNERMETVENGPARATFVILMMVRASNGSPANLPEKLIATLPEKMQAEARANWIPAALGDKQTKSYEPLLGAAEAMGQMPANELVVRIMGPQLLDSLLGDIVEGTPVLKSRFQIEHTPVLPMKEELRDAGEPGANAPVTPVEPEPVEPGGYQGQDA